MAAGKRALAAGDFETARHQFSEVVARQPGLADGWLGLAKAERGRGDLVEAEVAAMRALMCQPGWSAAFRELVAIAEAGGDTDRAIGVLEQFRNAHRADAYELTWALGKLTGLGADSAACALAESMSADGVGEPAAIAWLAARAARLEGPAAGDREFARRVAGRPAATATRAGVQYALALDDLERALEIFFAGDFSRSGPREIRALAERCFAAGRLTDAERVSGAAIRTPRGDATALVAVDRAVRGRNRVLRGAWSPPVIETATLEPVAGRVLHVAGRSLPYRQTGYTIRTQAIALAQRAAGFDPHVVTRIGYPWREGVPAELDEAVGDITYHRLPLTAGTPIDDAEQLSLNLTSLAALTTELRPAVLHAASDFPNGLIANRVAKAFGLPSIYEARGFWEDTWISRAPAGAIDSERYRYARERETEAMLGASHVVTLSEAMASEIGARGVAADRISVVPNAVDPDRFRPVPRDAGLAGRLGIAPGETVIGYISRLSGYEGVRFLIDAIAELIGQGMRVRGLIVGDGDELGNLRRQVRERGLAGRVLLPGRVPHAEVLEYYALIDVFVVPRTADRVSQLVTPLKPLEAMACGKALIVSGVDALRGMAGDEERGLVFEPENASDLARVAARLVEDNELRAAMGERARAWVVAQRSWQANAERYRAIYDTLGVVLNDREPRL